MVCSKILIVIFGIVAIVNGQRSPYAGSRPGGGYKDKFTPNTNAVNADPLANRFGATDGTTQRLPHDAYGDVHGVNYLNSLPVEKRPFWLVNYQAIEAIRNSSGGRAPVATLGNRFGASDVNRAPSSPNNFVVAEPGYVGLLPVQQNNIFPQQNLIPQSLQQSFLPQGSVLANDQLGNRGSFATNQGTVAGTQQNLGGLTLGSPTGVRGHFQG